ncbi:MAG: cytochrome c biogenesis protein DipZ, partial [Jatrophihabitans endophyticus]
MLTLVLIGLVGGVVTSISPCVLPVLPVILASGARDAGDESARVRRPVAVVVGLVVSFSVATLVGSVVLSALGLPQDLLRTIGIVVLLLIGLSLLVPAVGQVLERPFARVPRPRVGPSSNGLLLGLGLGLLYVPCAGPVLAAIAVVGATHRIGLDAVVLTAAFGVGAGVPLLVLALAGGALTRRVAALREHARG